MASLVLAAAFFVGIHVFVSGTALRGAIVARIGENGFRGAFSLASLAGIVWLSRAYAAAPRGSACGSHMKDFAWSRSGSCRWPSSSSSSG